MNDQTPASLPLYELIYRTLRGHILRKRFPRGLVLTESAVSRIFNTSRIPAAAALKRLHDEGLIRNFEGRGYLADARGRGVVPVRIDLEEAGLVLPPAMRKGLTQRNRGDRIYPDVEHTVASCLAYGRFMLNESALAEHYGVSRAVAHEVLTKLERTGLIVQDSNQRWYAGPLTADLIREHFQIRWILEPVALAEAAPKLDGADLKSKRERVAHLASDGHLGLAALETVERDLHVDVVGQCDSALLRASIRRSQLPLIATHSTFHRNENAEEVKKIAAEHTMVFDDLLAGHVSAAAAALEAHLRRSVDRNIELLRVLAPLPPNAFPPYLALENVNESRLSASMVGRRRGRRRRQKGVVDAKID